MPTGKAQLMSNSVEWRTPPSLANKYIDLYGLDLDVCAAPGMEVLPDYISPLADGLKMSWGSHRCWMNPPYGRTIKHWVKKACLSVMFEGTPIVVSLLPARTDTQWWHDFIIGKAKSVEFLRGRLKFWLPDGTESKHPAAFPSAIVIWGQ